MPGGRDFVPYDVLHQYDALNAWASAPKTPKAPVNAPVNAPIPPFNPPFNYGSLPSLPGANYNPTLPNALLTADQINQSYLNYLAKGVPNYGPLTQQVSDAAGHFLDPNDPRANYDVASQAAEDATMGGIVGSPLASSRANQRREQDVERRALLGNQLLTGQVSRLPPPYDVGRELISPSQAEQFRIQQEQFARELQFRYQQLSAQSALQAQENALRGIGLNRSGGGGGHPGGGGYSGGPQGTPIVPGQPQDTGDIIRKMNETYNPPLPGWGRTWNNTAEGGEVTMGNVPSSAYLQGPSYGNIPEGGYSWAPGQSPSALTPYGGYGALPFEDDYDFP